MKWQRCIEGARWHVRDIGKYYASITACGDGPHFSWLVVTPEWTDTRSGISESLGGAKRAARRVMRKIQQEEKT